MGRKKLNNDDFDNDSLNDDYDKDDDLDDQYDDDDEDMLKERITYSCNDCNYRWQKAYSPKSKDDDIDSYDDSYYDTEITCPMCGSSEIDRI
ncbi:MAG TPA: hypothetical protein PKY81_11720 [bacterium]|nr:hypothetical protein [bacterium]